MELNRRLVELLLSRASYRMRWKRKAGTRLFDDSTLNQQAVCAVLADYGYTQGLELDPRQMKDTVSRAVGSRPGKISGSTLRKFIEAFEMSTEDAQYLWDATDAGSGEVTVMGTKLVKVQPPKNYRTITAQEIHHIGPDGKPREHRTNLILEATNLLEFYPVITSADAVSIEPLRGGPVAGKPYRIGNEFTAVNIRFSEPVRPRHVVSLEYKTRFIYTEESPTQFRRHVVAVDTLEICVDFDPECLPTRIWWSQWPGLDEPAASEELVPLRPDHSVTKVVQNLKNAVVGFRWSFESK